MDVVISLLKTLFFDLDILVGIKTGLLFICLDTIFGWILALKTPGLFSIKKVPQFLATNIFPYIGALIITGLVAEMDSNLAPLFTIATGGVALKFGYEGIKEKLMNILK